MTSGVPSTDRGEEPLTYCQRHPDVESALRCGRCETLICPRCLVYTPGGVRCPDCAMLRRPPMYELGAVHYARAIPTAIAIGLAFGVIGAIILPPRAGGGFFLLAIALFGGSAAGSLIGEALSRATAGKRGVPMQAIAVGSALLAGATRLAVSGGFEVATRDLAGAFAVVVMAVAASGRLR